MIFKRPWANSSCNLQVFERGRGDRSVLGTLIQLKLSQALNAYVFKVIVGGNRGSLSSSLHEEDLQRRW
jgi:hypothetical protein